MAISNDTDALCGDFNCAHARNPDITLVDPGFEVWAYTGSHISEPRRNERLRGNRRMVGTAREEM